MDKVELNKNELSILMEDLQECNSSYLTYLRYGNLIIIFLGAWGLAIHYTYGLTAKDYFFLPSVTFAIIILLYIYKKNVKRFEEDIENSEKISDESKIVKISKRNGKVKLENGFSMEKFEINSSITNKTVETTIKLDLGKKIKYEYLPKSKFILHSKICE